MIGLLAEMSEKRVGIEFLNSITGMTQQKNGNKFISSISNSFISQICVKEGIK
jgi:hypothetical protein